MRLYGIVSLEVFGHLGFALDDAGPMFEIMLAETAPLIGLQYPPPAPAGRLRRRGRLERRPRPGSGDERLGARLGGHGPAAAAQSCMPPPTLTADQPDSFSAKAALAERAPDRQIT